MQAALELEMFGGAPEARLRRRRPGLDDLPWGTLDRDDFTPLGLAEARAVWTNGVFTEYASAAAFSAMASAFLECRAPIDLVAAAADIVVDEIDHAELASRLVMELGGAVVLRADFELIAPATTPGVPAVVRAAEIAIKTSCVGEALSISALARSHEASSHPLVRGVLDRLLRDEGPHARLGTWFLEWANERMSEDDREHLAGVALAAIAVYEPLWRGRCESCEAPAALGGMPVDAHARLMVEAVRVRVARPLARLGIAIDRDRLEDVLAG